MKKNTFYLFDLFPFAKLKKIISKKNSWQIIQFLLLACILFSIFLRGTLFSIGFEFDELFTAISTDPTLPFSWLYKNYLLVDVHPPLYNALLWIWNHFVAYGPEFWLRLPSFLMGLAALAEAWFLFPIRLGKRARLLFTVLLSCNLYVMAYAQHARSYMLVLLLAVPFTFLFAGLVHKVTTRRNISQKEWLYLGTLATLLCWSHYFGALLVVISFLVLLGYAWIYKRNLTAFIVVPCVVLLLFLPWLIPNFIYQIHLQRFVGNWWAQGSFWHAFLSLVLIMGGSFDSAPVLAVLLAAVGVYKYMLARSHKDKKTHFWGSEQGALLIVLLIFIACVGLVSLKMYLFITRYFIVLLPVAYLLIAGFLEKLIDKNRLIQIGLLVFLLVELHAFCEQRDKYTKPDNLKMPARRVSQLFRDEFANKKMFVVAMEAFPPVTMPALYGFYVNRVYGLNVPVTELFSLDETSRNEALKQQKEAFVWMPNCSDQKLIKLSLKWKRTIYSEKILGTVCRLYIARENSSCNPQYNPACFD